MLEGQTGSKVDTERLLDLLGDVEARIENMSAALQALRESVAGIHAALPAAHPAPPAPPLESGGWSFRQTLTPLAEPKSEPKDEGDAQPEPESKPRPSLSSGWPDESSWSQDFEWPAMKTHQAPAEDAPREEQAPFFEPDSLPEEADLERVLAGLDQVPPAPEAAWEGPSATYAPPPTGEEPTDDGVDAPDEYDGRRDAVSRAVEQMRAELAARFGETSGWLEESEQDAIVRNEISDQTFARMVEAARQNGRFESDGEPADRHGAPGESAETQTWQPDVPKPTFAATEGDLGSGDEAAREAVRRAVEMARAEMSSGVSLDGDRPLQTPDAAHAGSAGGFSDWTSMAPDIAGPPVIVIKDREGRVELARVFETLNRVNCGDNAALLNYTPHSVTVGLPIRASVPPRESLAQAIQSVFGRSCLIDSDGVRISVDLVPSSSRQEGAA